MEIPGVDIQFACNDCVCASCVKGRVHPLGTNSCAEGCLSCTNIDQHAKSSCMSSENVEG